MGLTRLSVSGRPCSPDGKVDRSMMLTTVAKGSGKVRVAGKEVSKE